MVRHVELHGPAVATGITVTSAYSPSLAARVTAGTPSRLIFPWIPEKHTNQKETLLDLK